MDLVDAAQPAPKRPETYRKKATLMALYAVLFLISLAACVFAHGEFSLRVVWHAVGLLVSIVLAQQVLVFLAGLIEATISN